MQLVSVGDVRYPHRLGEAELTLTAADGSALADTEVEVAQTGHAFGFGNIGFDFVDLANGSGRDGDAELAELWLDLFNTATLPFYWGPSNPSRESHAPPNYWPRRVGSPIVASG
ncbi:MAG TPA: hypothetical protein PLO15_07340 [Propionicimonas sp.]|nr:hypothetical protein [Propionicimonas sp.]